MAIQARLLARMTPEEVAATHGIHPDTVRWYADLFFDVIPCRDARDWITKRVLLPALVRPPPQAAAPDPTRAARVDRISESFYDGFLKLFADFGGRPVVDEMLAGMAVGKPAVSGEAVSAWHDEGRIRAQRETDPKALLRLTTERSDGKYRKSKVRAPDTSQWRPEKKEAYERRAKLETPLAQMDLPVRIINALEEHDVIFAGQLVSQTDGDLMRMENLGEKTLDELREAIRRLGLPVPDWTGNWSARRQDKSRDELGAFDFD